MMANDHEWGPRELTDDERRQRAKAKQEQLSVQLGCAGMILSVLVIWVFVARLFAWSMGWASFPSMSLPW